MALRSALLADVLESKMLVSMGDTAVTNLDLSILHDNPHAEPGNDLVTNWARLLMQLTHGTTMYFPYGRWAIPEEVEHFAMNEYAPAEGALCGFSSSTRLPWVNEYTGLSLSG
jgi:hypothetical protein